MIKSQLKKIVFGLVFVFISFNIRFSNGGFLNLLPDFVGYLIIIKALDRLITETHSEDYFKTRKYAFIMFFISVIFFMMDLLGVTANLDNSLAFIIFTTSIISLIINLLFLYYLTIGTIELTQDEELSQKLKTSFWFVAIGSVLVHLLILLPAIALLILVVTLIANVIYIINMNKIANFHSMTY